MAYINNELFIAHVADMAASCGERRRLFGQVADCAGVERPAAVL